MQNGGTGESGRNDPSGLLLDLGHLGLAEASNLHEMPVCRVNDGLDSCEASLTESFDVARTDAGSREGVDGPPSVSRLRHGSEKFGKKVFQKSLKQVRSCCRC